MSCYFLYVGDVVSARTFLIFRELISIMHLFFKLQTITFMFYSLCSDSYICQCYIVNLILFIIRQLHLSTCVVQVREDDSDIPNLHTGRTADSAVDR